jgi:inner centromere protein
MTPPPAQTRKPATSENYDISDIRSDESTDDEDAPRKKVPYWAQGAALKSALLQQDAPRRVFEELASGFVPHAPDLEKIFTKKRKRFYQRTSSAHWSSPPIKV